MGEFNGKKRSELPDSVFGIPQERKYPMPDEKHTRSAIKLFNHVEPKYEEQLAKAVIKNMKKYGIDGSVVGPNNRLRKYLPKDMIKESYIEESSNKSDFSYSSIKTSVEKSEFKRNFREVFKEDPTESSINYMQIIKYKGDLVGYIGFSRFKESKKKYLGIGNFMILKRYQRSGMGSKVISDIIDRYKDNYDEIYCYVDKNNTNAIAFYKKIAKVNTDNLTKYGYYVTLYSKSIGESAMLEGYLKSDKDIYYNKDKFDSGEINLCFITGLSGSGKSTMGRGMSSKDIEHYEMDDIICNYAFSDDNLKEYGGLVESFFKGPGKDYRLKRGDEDHNNAVFDSHENYEKEITQLFVKHAISYCKSHKGIKYVCDGIWVFMFIKPEQLKDCAVYIKGTSSIKSGYRALKRDIDEDKRNGMTSLQIFKHEFKRVKEDILYARENQKELKSFRSYFEKQSTNESYIEEGYFRSTDNLEFNLDKWSKSGNHNLLYITGISGSGKTTLAKEMCKKYKAEYIELDKFTLGIVKGLDRWFENVNNGTYEVHPLLKEYFSQLDHLTTNGSWSKPDMGNEHDKFLTWLIKKVKGNGTLYIVEGAQFFMKLSNMDPDLIKGEPLIVVGTSAFKSWIRRIKRDTSNDETISRFIYHLKKDVPMLFKYYFSNEKDLEKYIKNMQSNVNESYLLQEAFNNKVYHLSQTNLDGKTIQPTVPSNYMTKNGYEDGKTKRVCFATSIDGCLRGLSLKCEGMKLFVHVPDGNYNIYKPSNKEVPDASITGEVWIKKAVKMKCIGQIYVIGDKGEDGIPYKYGDKTAELYDWEWKWIDKFNESYIEESSKYKYSPPYTSEEIKRVYGNKVYKRLSKDPAHKYRMDTGIELIHKEPTKEELERIWKNWNLMSDYQKRESDKKSIELFGMTNQDHYNELINSYTLMEGSTSLSPQNTGISTVIFDIGDVLISDNFKELLMKDSKIPTELADTIKSLWFIAKDDIDDTMDLDTYREIVNKRMGPEFSKYIPKLFQYGIECVHVLDYTVSMIQDLKERGYKVYYLSNWSAWTHELLEKAGKFDFLKYMDGGIFSYDVGYMKPDEEIYRILLNRYKINPKEAIFFDDKKENIDAANKLGIHGVLFPRHDSSIIYNALSDMESKSLNEYGVTGGTMIGTNQPDSVYIVNYMQNNVFSGHKEQKQAICKKGMNQMYTTKDGKSVPVDKNKFKEEASDVSVFRFKGSPFLSYDKIVESAIQDSDYYSLLTGDDISSPEYMKYDNRFIEEEPYTEYLDDITSCIESSIVGTQYSEEYPYMKVLTESVDGRCWNYYNDINGYFIMNELTGLRSPSYDSIEEIPESQIKVIERGTIYLGE